MASAYTYTLYLLQKYRNLLSVQQIQPPMKLLKSNFAKILFPKIIVHHIVTSTMKQGFSFCIIKGDLRTICRFSYMKVYKLITLGTKFKTLLSLGRKITMFSKFITNYIEQG